VAMACVSFRGRRASQRTGRYTAYAGSAPLPGRRSAGSGQPSRTSGSPSRSSLARMTLVAAVGEIRRGPGTADSCLVWLIRLEGDPTAEMRHVRTAGAALSWGGCPELAILVRKSVVAGDASRAWRRSLGGGSAAVIVCRSRRPGQGIDRSNGWPAGSASVIQVAPSANRVAPSSCAWASTAFKWPGSSTMTSRCPCCGCAGSGHCGGV